MEEEAMISGLIQNLETSHVACTDIKSRGILETKMKELREMLDFLRGLKMEDKSKLKYLMADLVESAQSVEDMSSLHFTQSLEYYKREIESTKMRMINFGAAQDKISGDEEKEQVVVGLENVVQMLLDKAVLNNSSWPPHLSIWNIKGMIGIGKTTLARLVYNHKDVVSRFERRGWVSISNDMSYKEVLVELIQQMVVGSEEQLIGRDSLLEGKDNRSLRQMLCQLLKGKRFFIVFDNLLKGMSIRRILRGLGDKDGDHPRSRILCTSRYEVEGIYHNHNVQPLDSDKSWQLFLNTIFPGDTFASGKKEFSKELERKGKEMLKKCGGLPPAIIDVARQKAKQRLSGIAWEELFDSVDLSKSLKLLEPMYQTLGEELKLCFLCMSFFKENAIMREEKLEQIWAASGIESLDTLTRGLFGGPCAGLVKESIIEVAHEFVFKEEVKRCHMNPVLHLLSIKKAEEEIGFEILKSNGNSQTSWNPRHRVIHCGRDKFDHSKNQDNKNLNSLILHGGGCYLDDASLSYWKSLEILKILDMDDFGVKTLSETISTLTELRYLGLRNNYIQEIPHSFRVI
ncbi:putative disease resistance RPP13-like protein 3 [Salvia hispanica]|uniref:putative disease resistance RPP13-like protein 3 n=1 Tax=Salvia hispanica TaxID=49212 RepID=UPI002008FCA0|nr:putative disease resistance RPP13-like protein 3 [Salvia hispanica]